MEFPEVSELLLTTLRLYHDPVAVYFLDDPETFPVDLVPKKKLSVCQCVAHVKNVGQSVLLTPERLHCQTAAFVMGFPFDERKVKKGLEKFLRKEAAERLYAERPRLSRESFKALALVPLPKAKSVPDVVFMIVDAFQASHLLDFYLYGASLTHLEFFHFPNAAVCGAIVSAKLNGRPVLALPCPGAFSSGKMERGEVILSLPFSAFELIVGVIRERLPEARVSFLGGERLVGNDVCRNCPLISFTPPR